MRTHFDRIAIINRGEPAIARNESGLWSNAPTQ